MSDQFQILLVEDELNLARGLIFNLEAEGYQVLLASDGLEAMAQVERGGFDLVVLDLILPHLNGYEVLKKIRQLHPRLPVIILTAKLEESDRILGLELGADDYLTKPFHLKELLLRIKGMLRRLTWYAEPKHEEPYCFGQNRVDFNTFKAYGAGGQERTLTVKEAYLLKILIDHEGEAVSRKQLLEEVWGYHPDMVTRTVDTFMVRLRSYFEPNPKKPVHFLSLRGLGYQFVKEPE